MSPGISSQIIPLVQIVVSGSGYYIWHMKLIFEKCLGVEIFNDLSSGPEETDAGFKNMLRGAEGREH